MRGANLKSGSKGKERGAPRTHATIRATSQTIINITMEDLVKVADLIAERIAGLQKEVLTADEAASYLGMSKSYVYKLTMGRKIPFYRPMGKMVYFNRKELEQWLQANRCATDEELNEQAQVYCMKKGGR